MLWLNLAVAWGGMADPYALGDAVVNRKGRSQGSAAASGFFLQPPSLRPWLQKHPISPQIGGMGPPFPGILVVNMALVFTYIPLWIVAKSIIMNLDYD